MSERVLLVDDEINVLKGYQRALRGQFLLDVAQSGPQALEMIDTAGPYAIIVSDMQMPEMNGVQLLAKVKANAPDTVRVMLTGNSDQKTAIDAIHQGDIYRFLTKPCNKDDFARTLEDGIRLHQLIISEKELLQKTLAGSIRVLAELLSLTDPAAFGRTARLQKLTRQIVEQMGIERDWWLEPAILLSQIGCVTLPGNVSKKVASGQTLDTEEYRLFARHPEFGANLLAKIPRMQEIVSCIRYQEKNFDGTGVPHDGIAGLAIPFGARLLKVALDFDRGDAAGMDPEKSLSRITKNSKWYDPKILLALTNVITRKIPKRIFKTHIRDLREGMVVADNVCTNDGVLLIAKGLAVTQSVAQRLENYHDNKMIPAVISIYSSEDNPSNVNEASCQR